MRNIFNSQRIIPILVVFLSISIGVLSAPLNKSMAAGILPSEYKKGDIDNNQLVNMSDFGVWLGLFRGFKATGAYDVKGDLDLDQKIGMGDFGEWLVVWRAYKAYMEEGDTISTFEFSDISVGKDHTCGLDSDGNGYCWGDNGDGQLGTGDTTASYTPQLVSQPDMGEGERGAEVTFTSISAGYYHTCGLDSDGNGYCWGYNSTGQLGDGSTTNSTTPVLVSQGARPSGVTFTSISAGYYHTCGLGSDGNGYCWGNNGNGQLGNGSTTFITTPVLVSQGAIPSGVTFTSISAGLHHTCGLGSDGNGYCWGTNSYGQLGDGSTTNSTTPVLVSQGARPSGVTFTSISAGCRRTCGLGSDGNGYCWGYNSDGQLGTGNQTDSYTPSLVSRGNREEGVTFTSISLGYLYTCGLGSDGNGYCWGYNGNGQLGDSSTTSITTPVLVSQGARPSREVFRSIDAGEYHTCGVGSDGNGYCWGYNASGQLGTGDTTDSYTPKLVERQDSTTPVEIVSMLIHIVRTITNIIN